MAPGMYFQTAQALFVLNEYDILGIVCFLNYMIKVLYYMNVLDPENKIKIFSPWCVRVQKLSTFPDEGLHSGCLQTLINSD